MKQGGQGPFTWTSITKYRKKEKREELAMIKAESENHSLDKHKSKVVDDGKEIEESRNNPDFWK